MLDSNKLLIALPVVPLVIKASSILGVFCLTTNTSEVNSYSLPFSEPYLTLSVNTSPSFNLPSFDKSNALNINLLSLLELFVITFASFPVLLLVNVTSSLLNLYPDTSSIPLLSVSPFISTVPTLTSAVYLSESDGVFLSVIVYFSLIPPLYVTSTSPVYIPG